MKGRSG